MNRKSSTITSRSYSQSAYILPARQSQPVAVAAKPVDREYENWKAQNGFSKPLSNEEYFRMYGVWR